MDLRGALLFLTCLTLAAGCKEGKRYLHSLGFQPPPAETQNVFLGSTCCLCETRDHQNEIKPYAGKTLCEEASYSPRYLICEKVRISHPSCTFVRVRRRGGKLECSKESLFTSDEKEQREILPPSDVVTPCDVAELNRNAPGVQSNARNDRKDEVYCTCGTDASAPSMCLLTQFVNGQPYVLDSLAKPEGYSDCDEGACKALFEAAFKTYCPYIRKAR